MATTIKHDVKDLALAPEGTRRVMSAGEAGAGLPMEGGTPMIRMSVVTGDGSGAPPQRRPGGAEGAPGSIRMPAPTFVAASELPDYKPPFAPGAARADADGNVCVIEIS